jgi:lipopolysaccharide transport system permease protein
MSASIQIIRPPSFSLRALRDDLVRLIRYRDFLYTLTLHRIHVRYRQSALGYAWAVIQPVMLVSIYTLVFNHFTKIATGKTPYVIFAFSALVPWLYFSNGLSLATNGIVSNPSLVLRVHFPREILPLSYITAALVDFAIGGCVLGGAMAFYQIPLHGAVVWVLPIMILATIFLTGVALLCSTVHVKYRDVGLAMPFVLQVWLFATPVLYPLQSVPSKLRPYYELNPMAAVVDGFRSAVVLGVTPDLRLLGIAFLMSAAILVLSYALFRRFENTFADYI